MKRQLLLISACLIVLIGLFLMTDPAQLPSFLLIIPFILIFMLVFTGISYILKKRGLTRQRSLRIAMLCTGLPLLLLVLQSIGQLTIKDFLTAAVLFVLSYFYITRTTPS